MVREQQVRQLLDQGLACYGLGKLEEAVSYWQQALDLDPPNERAREYLNFVKSNWGPAATASGGAKPPPEPQPSVFDRQPEAAAPAGQPPRPFVKPAVAATGWGELFASPPAGRQPAQPADQTTAATPSPPPPPTPGTTSQPKPEPQAEPATLPPLPPIPDEPTIESAPVTDPAPPQVPGPASTGAYNAPTKAYESIPTVIRTPVETSSTVTTPDITEATREEPGPGPAAEAAAAPATDAWSSPISSAAAPSAGDQLGSAATVSAGSNDDPWELVAGGAAPDATSALPGERAQDAQSLLNGIKDLLKLDDFTGALELIDKLLNLEPDNHEALALRAAAEKQLTAMYQSKVGRLEQIPRVRISQEELIWLNLDHRAGFVLSLVDGRMSYDEILSICGLPEVDALRILAELLQEGVIEVT